MNLEDGDGSLLIRARKDSDVTRISLEFTDPALKVHAEQNADRIRAVLAERYDTEIDLNLGGRESDGSRNDAGDPETRRPRSVDGANRQATDATVQQARTTTTETRGLSNEWIG